MISKEIGEDGMKKKYMGILCGFSEVLNKQDSNP